MTSKYERNGEKIMIFVDVDAHPAFSLPFQNHKHLLPTSTYLKLASHSTEKLSVRVKSRALV